MFESPNPPLPEPNAADGPGILYFDPNPTTAKLATAGLRLAGYGVHLVVTEEQAVEVCRAHGPGGDGSIVALVLDAAAAPAVSASILQALLHVPGGRDLPGVLLLSRANPRPIPGAEALPSLKRPFTTPALLKVLREALDSAPPRRPAPASHLSEATLGRVAVALSTAFANLAPDRAGLERFTSALLADAELPKPRGGVAVTGDLSAVRLEALLNMLADDGVRGVLTVEADGTRARLHLDGGTIRMAEIEGGDEDLRFGRFVVEAGLLSEAEVEEAARHVDANSQLFGQHLVDTGRIRKTDLPRMLVNQAREITCNLLRWGRGRAHFSPLTELHALAAAAAASKAELLVAEVLLEGLRRVDDAGHMGPHMASVDDVFVRVDHEIARLGRHAFTRDELGVLELLSGRNSIKEIARKTRTGTFAVAKIVYRLSQSSLARRRRTPALV